jgi:hypothetical protein
VLGEEENPAENQRREEQEVNPDNSVINAIKYIKDKEIEI